MLLEEINLFAHWSVKKNAAIGNVTADVICAVLSDLLWDNNIKLSSCAAAFICRTGVDLNKRNINVPKNNRTVVN